MSSGVAVGQAARMSPVIRSAYIASQRPKNLVTRAITVVLSFAGAAGFTTGIVLLFNGMPVSGMPESLLTMPVAGTAGFTAGTVGARTVLRSSIGVSGMLVPGMPDTSLYRSTPLPERT